MRALAKVAQTNQIIYLNDIAQLGLNQRRINVAVVDLDAQRTNKVIEQVEQLTKAKVPVVAYQSSEQPYLLRSVCELGVQAVLTRCVSGSELRRAVLEVATGRRLKPGFVGCRCAPTSTMSSPITCRDAVVTCCFPMRRDTLPRKLLTHWA